MWAPTRTSHDPNPPLPLESAPPAMADQLILPALLDVQDGGDERGDLGEIVSAWMRAPIEQPPALPDAAGSMTARGLRVNDARMRRARPPAGWLGTVLRGRGRRLD